MTRPVDQPFRSKAEREMERALAAHYRELANPDIVEAIRRKPQLQQQQAIALPRDNEQQS